MLTAVAVLAGAALALLMLALAEMMNGEWGAMMSGGMPMTPLFGAIPSLGGHYSAVQQQHAHNQFVQQRGMNGLAQQQSFYSHGLQNSLAQQQAFYELARNAYTPPPRIQLPIPWMRPDALRRPKWQRRALVALSLILGVDRILPMGRILRS